MFCRAYRSLNRQETGHIPSLVLVYLFVSSANRGASLLVCVQLSFIAGLLYAHCPVPLVGISSCLYWHLSLTRYNLTFSGLNTIAQAERTFTLTFISLNEFIYIASRSVMFSGRLAAYLTLL